MSITLSDAAAVQASSATRTSHGAAVGTYSLSSLLTCGGCDRRLQPSRTAAGERVYLFLCGCRWQAIDAGLVERVVRDRVEAASVALVAGAAASDLGPVFRSLFVEVRVGADVAALTYRWRI
ncbi:hypothetical protein Daura_03855 [Dactylosporangium aurantiacum]|uniref:Uncharacterized protein n=1 Tax=Dactylosporangium aurantiacum TaxID=35754 RepID=A0A9Q9MK73_9ACTN|nr:hypothetical protein [Dactylosporangium aurantiacum]MDG6100507.1 hypothetical protein [Dactylosporangium aurantiacum]UWZ55391.1 hypothetical protein Daura_03855 [Dactylosporangium aurantiacum]